MRHSSLSAHEDHLIGLSILIVYEYVNDTPVKYVSMYDPLQISTKLFHME